VNGITGINSLNADLNCVAGFLKLFRENVAIEGSNEVMI
jgi:hypothetical protein